MADNMLSHSTCRISSAEGGSIGKEIHFFFGGGGRKLKAALLIASLSIYGYGLSLCHTHETVLQGVQVR